MKFVMLSAITLASLMLMSASGKAQRVESGTTERIERLDAGVTRIPERPSTDTRHRDQNFTPESHVPPRSPDLGEPYFPLSPSIGPGSGLLGPEAGRAPARLRSNADTEGGRANTMRR